MLINMIFAATNAGCALYLAWCTHRSWRLLPTGWRVANVATIVLNVLVCALNLCSALL